MKKSHDGRESRALKAFGLLFGVFWVCPGTSAAQTTTTFDVLAATETLTVVGTTTLQGSAFSVGGSTLVVVQGDVGIGTSAPRGQLHVAGSTLGGADAEFIWFASSGALRAGGASGSQWSPGNIGLYSDAFGQNNEASVSYAGVCGGTGNSATGLYSIIAGGVINQTDDASNGYTTVAGGSGNEATIQGATVGGGLGNMASGQWSTVGGGYLNIASGVESMVPGGVGNTASGEFSFAAGDMANAEADGSFVWADAQGVELFSTVENEFKIRAAGGFVLLNSSSQPTVIVSSGSIMISTSASAATAVPNIYISSANGNVGIGTQNPISALAVNGVIVAASSVNASAFFGDGSHLSGIAAPVSTRQVLTSGTAATYTTPTNVRQLRIRMVGGGGEGSSNGPSTGVSGASTTWITAGSTIAANGGGGGVGQHHGGAGGSGGTGGTGIFASSSVYRSSGGPGGNGSQIVPGGQGGSSAFGGGGTPTDVAGAQVAGSPNTGGGGGGYTTTSGGGAGEYVELIISSSIQSKYYYTVGAGGSGTASAAAGGSGVIIVDEIY